MMTHDDILRQIPDYVLGLLSAAQLNAVENHVAHCTACRQVLIRERKLGRLVRSAVEVAAEPDNARLRSLMPAIPQQRRSALIFPWWQKQLAPAAIVLLLLLGGFMLNSMLPAGSVPSFVATAHAATATSTYTPTATLAESISEIDSLDHFTIVKKSAAVNAIMPVPSADSDRPLETPDPLPTPVAAVRRVAQ